MAKSTAEIDLIAIERFQHGEQFGKQLPRKFPNPVQYEREGCWGNPSIPNRVVENMYDTLANIVRQPKVVLLYSILMVVQHLTG